MITKLKIKKLLSNAWYLVAIGKPHVFLRYLKKYFLALVFNKISPRQIDIALSFNCNLNCDHCFSAPLLNINEQEMSYDVLKKVAKECLELGITVIHFTGGEILMRNDLEKVIGLFNPKKNIIYIQSNGTLGTYKRFKSLKKAGLDFFGASLEYPDKKKQDTFRHYEGYFDKTIKVLETAKKAGLQTSVNITIDNKLIHSHELPAFIEMLGKKGHIVYGNIPVPVGRFKEKKELLWLKNEREKLYQLASKYPYFRTEFDSNFGKYGCPAMKEKIYLCAYGDVLACPYIHISFGNVNKESLLSIFKTCTDFEVFNYYHDHCLAAENLNFIEKIIAKTDQFDRQPVSHKHFEEELKQFEFKKPGLVIRPATLASGGPPGGPDLKIWTNRNFKMAEVMTNPKKPYIKKLKHLNFQSESIDCPCCGSKHKEKVIDARDFETNYDNRFNVVKCVDCHLVYTSPRPSMPDLFKFFYNENYLCYTHSGLTDKIREEYLCKSRFKDLKKLLPDGGNFLDVGCSHGYFLEFLQRNTDWKAFGCEPNLEMAELANKRSLSVKASTLLEAGFESDFFDMVYMSHVLEHVPDLVETVNEVFRILKPGGIFLTENPDFDSPIRKRYGSCWWGYHLPRHLTHFTHESMTKILSKAGFKVEKIKPCFRPGPIAWSIQNTLKNINAPDFLCSFFGLQNPVFVAFMSIPALYYLKKGHTDMMETIAVKP